MSASTTNLGLTLPAGTENVNRAVLNNNFSIIDGAVGPVPANKNLAGMVAGKVNEPASEGTSGQVLATNGNGGRSWISVAGSGGDVPAGGTTGQVLAKTDDTDFAVEWTDPSGGAGNLCLKGSLTAISAAGTISDIALTGLTAAHKVCNWGLFADSAATTPISPTEAPADITITEGTDSYSITIANLSSAFWIRPVFILPQNI